MTTGASSDPAFPFTIEWTCRGSTTDGSTDQVCEAFAEPAQCGVAHQADHESLTSSSSDLCELGQVNSDFQPWKKNCFAFTAY